ncbi:hypothetical protein SEA_TRIBUTE_227 [Streptomyces phage Tribute]|uniref:Uncharacterized protein n=5 Tax=Samistivirus peebs TaxID=2560790 RepID=A0A5Q2WKV0_9CAUD|nr:hypothetical protein FDI38_gp078 [Streptomyces phage Peebs]ASR76618.1 hypothetical protein SEA_SUSHI23_232 [Streptomyces phage Sushi23]QAX95921.1 hypothetical protein SEA_TEUTSCH_230 [Streptomyces phage Teutsch]QGH78377.1 hypothetical protein SEA_TRIBUTE_227 [Streptomyces phage Tribute]QRI46178.1 hypothetical protein SEA_CROSS_230 [Streptomyces phage Cross]WDS51985.1 RNA binding protein [Streptomyces phage Pepperwood]WNN95549.1 hypothetical protein SEA_WATERMOORE_230 [Streptomyces phage Wa
MENTEETLFLVGDEVEVVWSDSMRIEWIGFRATVLPWPEGEEQYEDGLLQNWLKPAYNRPDGFGMSEFMWPTKNLIKVG